MTLLNVVLAVANDTPYALASLRSVGSVLGMETETRMRYYFSSILFREGVLSSTTSLMKETLIDTLSSIPQTKSLKHPFYNLLIVV